MAAASMVVRRVARVVVAVVMMVTVDGFERLVNLGQHNMVTGIHLGRHQILLGLFDLPLLVQGEFLFLFQSRFTLLSAVETPNLPNDVLFGLWNMGTDNHLPVTLGFMMIESAITIVSNFVLIDNLFEPENMKVGKQLADITLGHPFSSNIADLDR